MFKTTGEGGNEDCKGLGRGLYFSKLRLGRRSRELGSVKSLFRNL